MEITAAQTEPGELAAIAAEAADLLAGQRFDDLSTRFGYAVAFGRELAPALKADLTTCLDELGADRLSLVAPTIRISRFEPGSEFVALAECLLAAEPQGRVLLELVVTGQGEQLHVTLEQVSAVA